MYTLDGIKKGRDYHKQQGWDDGPKDWAIDYLIELNTELLEVCEALLRNVQNLVAQTGMGAPLPVEKNIKKAKEAIAKAKGE